MMTRDEHLTWCKKRALEYVEAGDLAQAVISMLSDIEKHPELKCNAYLAMAGTMAAMDQDEAGVRRFINGFN